MGKKAKWILGLAGLIIVILIVRSVTSGSEEEVVVKEEFPIVEISSPKQDSSDSEADNGLNIESYSGSGDTTLNDVMLNSGVLIIRTKHEGSGDFGVSLVGADATQVSFKETGNFTGSVAHSVYKASDFSGDPGEGEQGLSEESIFELLEPGAVSMEVTADGPWTIDVIQGIPPGGKQPPIDWQGSGQAVIKWIDFDKGNFKISMEHTGSTIFQAYLLKSDGSHTEMMVDINMESNPSVVDGKWSGAELINFSPDYVFGVEPGLYALAIVADGEWKVTIPATSTRR
ncbi:MAG: hypothetical protein VYC65_05025 [Chloroflexota bacterium]|nr:hypothetical protein [Chloroflexota bacterium]MQG37132.1 hypothetical protein [SAR202 cluster bacterium]|tara:strand:- start:4494 stop:5351 length:858 start_codon:yes stop_codon:yes gene_type:complete